MLYQLHRNIVLFALFATAIGFSAKTLAHGQHVNHKPWQVCKEAKLGDECRYTVDSHDKDTAQLHIGSCQSMSKVLMCVRNKPIESITISAYESQDLGEIKALVQPEEVQPEELQAEEIQPQALSSPTQSRP